MRQRLLLALCLMMGSSVQATISIGTTVALTGEYSHTGQEQLHGYQMWVEEVNKVGGLQGHQVHLIYYDDKSNPEISAQLYEKLITSDKVDLLFGPYTSRITMAASPIAEKYGFPLVSTGASAPEIWARGYKNTFGLYTPANYYMDQILEFTQTRGLQKVALVYENTLFPQTIAKEVKNKIEQLKMHLIFEEEYSTATTNFMPMMQRIKAQIPEIVIGESYSSNAITWIRQARASRLEAKIVAVAVGPKFSHFDKNLESDSQEMTANLPWKEPLNLPGLKEFAIRYQKKYGYRPGYPATGGYGAGQILASAIREANSLERDKIRHALLNLQAITLFGPYQVDATGKQIGKPGGAIQWMKEEQPQIFPKKVDSHPMFYLFPLE